jgi:ribosomal protein L12E/L44/L45/RPP1/RPP2
MKALKVVLIACSLSAAAAAAAAHAQTTAPAADGQQIAQANEQRMNRAPEQSRMSAPVKKAAECVGPISYCNIFFGS